MQDKITTDTSNSWSHSCVHVEYYVDGVMAKDENVGGRKEEMRKNKGKNIF